MTSRKVSWDSTYPSTSDGLWCFLLYFIRLKNAGQDPARWPAAHFVNKVWLETCHCHLFMDCLWLLSGYSGGVEWLWQKWSGLQSLKYLLSSSWRRSFLTLALSWFPNPSVSCDLHLEDTCFKWPLALLISLLEITLNKSGPGENLPFSCVRLKLPSLFT